MKNPGRLAALAFGLAAVLAPLTASAAWLTTGSGQGHATATAINQPTAPSLAKSSVPGTRAPAVTVTWPAVTLASGDAVGGYDVWRHAGSGATLVCSVKEPSHTCLDTNPDMRAVSYAVVARIGANWVSKEGPGTAFQYDTTAPVTSASQSAAVNGAGWANADTTVTLSATDAESGVKSITYSLAGGTPTTITGATASVPVSTEGTTSISYSATDNVGNTETTKTFTVRIDKTAPTVTATAGTTSGGTSSTPVTLALAATDGVSGVQSVSYQVGTAAAVTTSGSAVSVPITANGTTSVRYWATDVAGNVSTAQTYTVTIAADTTGPVFGSDGIIGITAGASYSTHDNSTGWAAICNGKDAICASVTDPGSGVASVSYNLVGTSGDNAGKCWNGTAWTSGSSCSVAMTLASGVYQGAPIGHQVMGDGGYTLTVTATDSAGNRTPVTISFTTTSKK